MQNDSFLHALFTSSISFGPVLFTASHIHMFLLTYSYTFPILLPQYCYKVAVTVAALFVFRHFYTRRQEDSYCWVYKSRQTAQHVIAEIIQIYTKVHVSMRLEV